MHAIENFDVLQLGVTFQPFERITCEKAILTLVTPGMEHYALNFLDTLFTNGNVDDAQVIVLALNSNDKIKELKPQFPQAQFIEGSVDPKHYRPYLKSLLYASNYFVDAKHYVTLDIDTLILESIQPLFEIMAMHHEDMVFCVEDQGGCKFKTLEGAFRNVYWGEPEALNAWNLTQEERNYPFIVNDGVMAANRNGIENIRKGINAFPDAMKEWARIPQMVIRNQFLFNLFVARYQSIQELDRSFNMMLNFNEDEQLWREGNHIHGLVGHLPIKILHVTSEKNKVSDYPLYDAFYKQMRLSKPISEVKKWTAFQDLWDMHQNAFGQNAEGQKTSDHYRICHDIALHRKTRRTFFLNEKDPMIVAAVAAAADEEIWGLTQSKLKDWKRLWNLLPLPIQSRIQIDTRATRNGIAILDKNNKSFDLVFVQSFEDSALLRQELRWARQILSSEGAVVIQRPIFNKILMQDLLAECGFNAKETYETCTVAAPIERSEGTVLQRPSRLLTIGIVACDDRAYANIVFTRSLKQQDYDPACVRVIVTTPANNPQSLKYFRDWAAKNKHYADVQVIASTHDAADSAPLFQEILETYLNLSSDAGLMLWDSRMDWSPNTLQNLCNSPYEITQGFYIADAAKSTWSVLNWEKKEKRSVIAPLEDLYYQDEVSCACLGGFFMTRSLWECFQETHGGWKNKQDTETLLSDLQRNSVLLKSVTAWHYTDDKHAVTIVFNNDEKKPRLYQKRPGPPPPPPIEESEEDTVEWAE